MMMCGDRRKSAVGQAVLDEASDRASMEAARRHARQARAIRAPLFVLLPLVAWLAWPAQVVPRPKADQPGAYVGRLENRLNPNTAKWWELTALPRLGKTLAQRIVTYRQEHAAENGVTPVFGAPADLERVHGIGPKTVLRLAPHLALAMDGIKPGSPPPTAHPRPTPPDRGKTP